MKPEERQALQPYRRLGDHPRASLQRDKGLIRDPKGTLLSPRAEEDQVIGVAEVPLPHLLDRQPRHPLLLPIAEMLADVSDVIVIAIGDHPLRYRAGRVVPQVGQDADHPLPTDQSLVKRPPRTTGQRDHMHILVGKQCRMGQHLEGVEVGEESDLRLGVQLHDPLTDAIEYRVTGGHHHHILIPAVAADLVIYRRDDVDPVVLRREEGAHDLVVPSPAGEVPVRADHLLHLLRESLLPTVADTDEEDLHTSLPGRIAAASS